MFRDMILNEKKFDLANYEDEFKKATARNDRMFVRLMMATLIDDKRLIEIVKAINNIIDYEKNATPIREYEYTIYSRMNDMGRDKYGEDWDKYIYPNT